MVRVNLNTSVFIAYLISSAWLHGCTPQRDHRVIEQLHVQMPSAISILKDISIEDDLQQYSTIYAPLGIGQHNVYMFDPKRAELIQMDRDLSSIRRMGRFGQGKGDFSRDIRQIIVTELYVIVVDRENARAVIYSHDGAYAGDLMMESVARGSSPIGWCESTSRLYYFTPSSYQDKSLNVFCIRLFPGLLRGSARYLELDRREPMPNDSVYSDVLGVVNGSLYVVDNYIDGFPANQISFQMYSTKDGSIVKKVDLFDEDMIDQFNRAYIDDYFRVNDERTAPMSVVFLPFACVWPVHSGLLVGFLREQTLFRKSTISMVGYNLISGETRNIETDLFDHRMVYGIAVSNDSTFVVSYIKDDVSRLFVAALTFDSSSDTIRR